MRPLGLVVALLLCGWLGCGGATGVSDGGPSSVCADEPGASLVVDFGEGVAGCPGTGGLYYARCVR
jgi:hypothetical protein